MGDTKIEWVRADDGTPGLSWNALRAERIVNSGTRTVASANHCEHVNEACRFCYAERGNARLGGLPFKPGHRKDYTFKVNRRTLLLPLHRRRPTRIFVESMSDAFGEWWPREFVDQLYAVMAMTPQHTYINLSKRPERRLDYLADQDMPQRVCRAGRKIDDPLVGGVHGEVQMWAYLQRPLPNVIEGVSVSCQEEADLFVPILLATRCHARVVSAEPLLGPIDFSPWLDSLSWIIAGGESGPHARPMHPQWARDIRDQCKAAGVWFHFKQWGEWLGGEANHGQFDPRPMHAYRRCDNHSYDWPPGEHRRENFGSHPDRFSGDWHCQRVGKKAAGRLLDGIEHNEFPKL